MFTNLIEDLDVYSYRKGWPKWLFFVIPLIYPVTWPIITYRFGSYVVKLSKYNIIKYPLLSVYFIFKRLFEILFAIEISEHARIGKGLYIAHTGGTIVAHGVSIGTYPSLHQHVTIGGAGRGDSYGHPTIGDRVFFGAGCNVVGKITLGNDVAIGANAVVTKSARDNEVLVGLPAKAINTKGSSHFIHFRGKQNN
ncbi:MAG: hypothetical protein PHD01_05730 [Geobacteraceae bacterium]|nr:hypothetical protein [Geobacteraceae bacterium]